jgi:hypothetical protein
MPARTTRTPKPRTAAAGKPRPTKPPPVNEKLLGIYLNDHLAGSTVGVELARRLLGSNTGTEFEPFLERLVKEIEEDRESLVELMRSYGVGEDRIKVAFAWVAEKTGRLKLNGSIISYSPLSRLVELEGLSLGVEGKLSLWRAVQSAVGTDPRSKAVDLPKLIERASKQRDELEVHRLRAAELAFVAD